ncbi:hypothetical protein JCM3766R1_006311 [Sporobolomyces carnicolor]
MSSTPSAPAEDGAEPPLLAPSLPARHQSSSSFLSAPSSLNSHDHHSQQSHYSDDASNVSTPQFSPYSTVSIPPTPQGHDDDHNPADHADVMHRALMNLELHERDQGTVHHAAHGVGSEARHLNERAAQDDSNEPRERLATELLNRTSASEQVSTATSSSSLDPVGAGLTVPGPPGPTTAMTASMSSSAASSTKNHNSDHVVSSTVATPGDSRVATPSLRPAAVTRPTTTTNTSNSRPPLSSSGQPQQSSAHLSVASSTAKKNGSSSGHHQKSVFGKLFDRDKNSSNVSVASSVAMEHGGGGSGSGQSAAGGGGSSPGGDHHHGGGALEGASLMRRKSGQDKEREKRDKELKEREKKERKEREKREKEELKEREKREKHDQKEQRERERSHSRGRTPSQNGRPRSGSHGHHDEKSGGGGALGGAMDFMRIKVQRKTSVTSRKSDDGKSDHGGGGDEGRSQYGGSETKSRGGQSNASLSKKYGVCDKVIVGKGATAVVRLAHKWDRSTERLYAVKEFRKRRKNETEKEYVKKLTSEFCISSTLHHHNVVETVDLVQDEQQHWCEVMEYCPGGDLYAAIKKGDLEPAEINSYFKQIIAGISYLHSMGVAHRDIKPENLLIDAKGHVKITDFGVSDVFRMCWEKKTHLSKGLCGSEPYIAPEQFEHKEYDARLVDVWAAAVVFYCMHFQELPWRVAKPSDPSFGPYVQLYSTSSSTPPPLSNLVPRECRSIIRRMLDPDPRTRATTEVILNDPWFNRIEVIPPLEGILPPVPTLP